MRLGGPGVLVLPGVVGSVIVEGRLGRSGLRLLYKVLRSTLQVPYEDLILVEHNGDGGVYYFVREWAGEYGVGVDRVEARGPASSAFRALVKRFLDCYDHEWLLLVWGLLELRPGWWAEASQHTLRGDTGLVWGVVWSPGEVEAGCPGDSGCLESKVRRFSCTGGLEDALLRRRALEDLAIPGFVRHSVGSWVYWWLRCRGWAVAVVASGAVDLGGGRPGPAEAVYEAYRLGVLEDCSPASRENLKGPRGLASSLLLSLAAGLAYRLSSGPRGPRRADSGLGRRWRLALARLKYGSPRHPCEVILGMQAGKRQGLER